MAYGKLEALVGPMFAGKTTETLKRILWSRTGLNKNVKVFKPAFDNRYAETEIVSHDGLRSPAYSIDDWDNSMLEGCDLVVFDEIQFFADPHFKSDISTVVKNLLEQNIDVIVAGLDMDHMGQPFEVPGKMLAMADTVEKLKANCTISGLPAGKTYKKVKDDKSVELGGSELYEARSNDHWNF